MKSKVILAATGGVIGVATLAMAGFVYLAYSAKTDALEGGDECEGLESVEAEARRLSSGKVYPCAASVTAVKSNDTLVAAWKDEAFKLAARGDRPVRQTTSAQFKADMVSEAKRLVALPGAVQGRIAKPDFAFGPFKDYIAEGKMPADAKLAELQRQWDDVVLLVETLSQCGIAELLDVQLKAKPDEGAAGEKNARKNARKAKGGKVADVKLAPAKEEYVVTFTTRPQGLVKSLNALATCERFAVVEDFVFAREKDVLVEKLGGGDKKEAAQQQSGARRRRRGQAVAEKTEEGAKPKGGIVTDPLLDEPFKVELTVATYDFRTLQEPSMEEEKK